MKTILFSMLLLLFAHPLWATTTRVGNGDNGADLEGFTEIKKGKIFNTRALAAKKLKALNIGSLRGLGNLLPEVEKSQLYITKKDISDLELKKMGAFETDMRGFIYARTFARPYAPTRFFPVSETLNNDQLIALHIREALHRALPKDIREKEGIVTEITLAITAPEATFDSIQETTERLIPQFQSTTASNYYLNEDEIKRSSISLSSSVFNSSANKSPSNAHIISSRLYPFGGSMSGVGLGIKMSYLSFDGEGALGPLGLSFLGEFNTRARFKIYWFLEQTISSSSSDLWKNSSFGRDLTRVGVKMHSLQTDTMSLTNSVQYTLPSSATDSTFSEDIVYDYGGIISARVDLKRKWKNLGFGGFIEYSIADEMKVTNGNFDSTDPREKVVVIGPEIAWLQEDYSVVLYSNFVVNDDENFNLDRFSDIFYYGAGRENIGLKINYIW